MRNDKMSDITDLSEIFDEDFTMEWFDVKGRISDVRITKGYARYPIRRKWGTWLYHRWPWLPSWLTGWVTLRFTKPCHQHKYPGDQ